MLKKRFAVFLLSACMTMFFACKDDDEVIKEDGQKDNQKEVVGIYKGDLNVELPGGEDGISSLRKITLTPSGDDKVTLLLKDFSFQGVNVGNIELTDISLNKKDNSILLEEKSQDLNLSLGGQAEIKATATVNGTVEGSNLNLTLSIDVVDLGKITVTFSGIKMDVDNESTEAKIVKLSFDSPFILEQPVIGESSNITLYISDDAKPEDLKEVTVTVEVSPHATITPASDTKVDLSAGTIVFTVVAEDGIAITEYTITTSNKKTIYDFENWFVVNPKALDHIKYSAPVGTWASCNNGISTLVVMGRLDKYAVTKTDIAHSGTGAAKLETLDTKGSNILGQIVPKITAGSLYTGLFNLNWSNTLMSTKFGTAFSKKPVAFEGYYKYTPGQVFYRSSGDPKQANKAEKEDGTIDQCAISAVLYEYDANQFEKDESAGTNTYSTYLTGVDIHNSSAIVATAVLKDGSAKDQYTLFSENFEYIKEYDSKKSYRLAIIASSSVDGDKFSGAPGSVLYLDNLTIISE